MDDPIANGFLTPDGPRPHDPHFVVAVMRRIEQRRFRREMATVAALSVIAALLLISIAPALDVAWADSFESLVNNGVMATVLLIISVVALQFAVARND
jgi:hypothetical protein